MVLPLIIIGVLLLAFSPQLASAVKNIISSKDSDVEKQQQINEIEKQARREDEGIFATLGRIVLGDKAFDDKPTVAKDTTEIKEPGKTTIRVRSSSPLQTSEQTGITINQGALRKDSQVIGFTNISGFGDFIASRKKEVLS